MQRPARCLITLVAAAVVVVTAAASAAASFPGTNGRITFVRDGDIYSVTPEGQDVRRLTSLGRVDYLPFNSRSPDGERIVFQRAAPRRPPQVWIMNPDGSDQRRLFADPRYGDQAPWFSPDGGSVIFARCARRCSIWRVNLDGTGLQPLTPFSRAYDFHPNFSPSGASISFTSIGRAGVEQAGYVMNADGTGIRRLTPVGLAACCPDWAPDGSRLVVASRVCAPECPGRPALWTVRPDGTGLTRLTRTRRLYDLDGSWSPDGTSIVFTRQTADGRRQGIYVVSASGGRARLVQRRAFLPRWGPAPAQPGP